jgi:hypothetical protein
MTTTSVEIPSRFQGPPTSGNGGYSAGLLAEVLGGGTVEVTLRAPPPLDRPLRIEHEGERALLIGDEQVIAEAMPSALELSAPAAPTWEQAVDAASRYSGFHTHAFPNCFTCGPQRRAGDGLRIFSGPLKRELVVAPWEPDASLPQTGGFLTLPVLWAALDCPGYWAFASERPVPALLGRMCAHFVGEARAGERYLVAGWVLGQEGRKRHSGTALFDLRGRCLGVARQTWIELRNA